jgi:tRNA(fMet)-specific endonuclease VapC
MAFLAQARSSKAAVAAYGRLLNHLETFRRIVVLGYTDAAAEWLERLKSQRSLIGTMDLRIASIVLASDGVLVTRNSKDFEKSSWSTNFRLD